MNLRKPKPRTNPLQLDCEIHPDWDDAYMLQATRIRFAAADEPQGDVDFLLSFVSFLKHTRKPQFVPYGLTSEQLNAQFSEMVDKVSSKHLMEREYHAVSKDEAGMAALRERQTRLAHLAAGWMLIDHPDCSFDLHRFCQWNIRCDISNGGDLESRWVDSPVFTDPIVARAQDILEGREILSHKARYISADYRPKRPVQERPSKIPADKLAA